MRDTFVEVIGKIAGESTLTELVTSVLALFRWSEVMLTTSCPAQTGRTWVTASVRLPLERLCRIQRVLAVLELTRASGKSADLALADKVVELTHAYPNVYPTGE